MYTKKIILALFLFICGWSVNLWAAVITCPYQVEKVWISGARLVVHTTVDNQPRHVMVCGMHPDFLNNFDIENCKAAHRTALMAMASGDKFVIRSGQTETSTCADQHDKALSWVQVGIEK